jgi:YidC/Oxa1 family membrane protein insertase
MTDIRRTLLWVVFTMSLVLLWDAWNKHTGQPSLFGPTVSSQAPKTTAAPPPVPGAAASAAAGVPTPSALGASTAGVPAAAGAPGVPAAPIGTATAETVTISTDLVRATLSTRGGELQRLELLRHHEYEKPDQPVVLFDQSAKRVYLAQTGLITAQPGVSLPNHLSTLKLASAERELKDGQNQLQVRFESEGSGAVKLAKVYTFKRGDYAIEVTHEVSNTSTEPLSPQLYLQLVRDGNVDGNTNVFAGPVSFTGPALYTDAKKFQKLDFKDIEKGKADHEKAADNGWVAMVQHYFASAWVVPDKATREFRTAKVSENLYSIATVLPLGEVAPGSSVQHKATLFSGPQEEKKLEAMAPGLELVKDYGWFTVLAKPLFWLLDLLHGVIGNWGWAIVALVFLLKAAFYWLNASAYKSMAKMKAINPRVMEMRERLKDKPQQMQQEMMKLYREEKVNPLGGCLPIVVQMPFFIALYWVLLSSVEMRNAPWVGWITDLSSLDPYFILPLLMTASTLLQTWLNPTPPDPVQAKLMWIMPLLFSVMFFFFPAGLVLYWLTNNILSIAQQWFINKKLGVLGK